MILKGLFARKPDKAKILYEAIVAAARQEKFYAQWGVPDTIDGRFEMISLHLFLVLDRLKEGGADTQKLRQQLTDTFFADMDRSLREMGVGDLSVGKKVRKMAEVFYGRVTAYAAALERGGDVEAVLRRNIFAELPGDDVTVFASWVRDSRARLANQDLEQGKVVFT